MPFVSGFYRPTPENPAKWKAPAGKGWWDRFSVEEVRLCSCPAVPVQDYQLCSMLHG